MSFSKRVGSIGSFPVGGGSGPLPSPGRWVRTEYEVETSLFSPVTPQTPPSTLWSNYNQIMFKAPIDVSGPVEIEIDPSIANGRWVVGVLNFGSIVVSFSQGSFSAQESIAADGQLYWLVLDEDQGLKILPIAPPEVTSGFEVFVAVDPTNDYSAEEGAFGYVAVNASTAAVVYLPTDSPIGSEWVVQDVFGSPREYALFGGLETQITISSLAGQAINGRTSVSITQAFGAIILFKDTANSWKVTKRSDTNILSSGESAVGPGYVAADAYYLLMNTIREPIDVYLNYTRLDDGQVINIVDDTPIAADGVGNLLTDSPQLDVPDWVIYGGVTDDGLSSGNGPDGVLKARKLHIPASSGSDANVITNFGNVTATDNWCGSVWLRGTVGGEQVWLHAFTVAGVGASVLCTLTTEWQQFSVASLFTAFTDNVYVEIGYDGSFGALTPIDACDIEAAYAQLEQGTEPSNGGYGYAATNPITIRATASNLAPTGTGIVDVIDTNGGYRSYVYDKANNRLVPIGASSTGGGGVSIPVVDTIADLAALDVADFDAGSQAFVLSVRSYWRYDPTDSVVSTDDITIVEASVANTYWYRSTSPDRSWAIVEAWYVNNGVGAGGWGAGNDENDGLTMATPLATPEELTRRTFIGNPGQVYAPYFELYIGPDGMDGELFLSSDMDVYGQTTVEASDTVASITAFARTGVSSGQQVTTITTDSTFWDYLSSRLYVDANSNLTGFAYNKTLKAGKTKFFTSSGIYTNSVVGHTIERHLLPVVALSLQANGRYVGFETVDLAPLYARGVSFFQLTQCIVRGVSQFEDCSTTYVDQSVLKSSYNRLWFGVSNVSIAASGIETVFTIPRGTSVDLAYDTIINCRVGGAIQMDGGTLTLGAAGANGVEVRDGSGSLASGAISSSLGSTVGMLPGSVLNIPASSTNILYGADNGVIFVVGVNSTVEYGDKTYLVAGSTSSNWTWARPNGTVSIGTWTALEATKGVLPQITPIVQTVSASTVAVLSRIWTYVSCATGGACTVNLPGTSDGLTVGDTVVVKDASGTGAATNNITINPSASGGYQIDGAASLVINTTRGSYTLVFNGSGWSIV